MPGKKWWGAPVFLEAGATPHRFSGIQAFRRLSIGNSGRNGGEWGVAPCLWLRWWGWQAEGEGGGHPPATFISVKSEGNYNGKYY